MGFFLKAPLAAWRKEEVYFDSAKHTASRHVLKRYDISKPFQKKHSKGGKFDKYAKAGG